MLGSPRGFKGVDFFSMLNPVFSSRHSPRFFLNVGSQFGLGSAVRTSSRHRWQHMEECAFFVVSLQHVYSSIMLNEKMRILWKHVPFLSQSWKWKTLIQSNLFFGEAILHFHDYARKSNTQVPRFVIEFGFFVCGASLKNH